MTSNRDLFIEMQQEAAAQERSKMVREKYQQLQYLEIDSKTKNNGNKNKSVPEPVQDNSRSGQEKA